MFTGNASDVNPTTSIEFLLMGLLSKKYNFQTKLIYANQTWGSFDGVRWTGSTGLVYHKVNILALKINIKFKQSFMIQKTELGMCGITKSLERSENFDITYFTFLDTKSFLSRYGSLKPRTWIAMNPFTIVVWTFIFGTLVLVTIAVFVNIIYKEPQNRSYNTFGRVFMDVFAVLTNQCKSIFTNFNQII